MPIRHPILAARDRKAQPWKNGGGVTREIAVHPPGADMDGFAWRISTAEVASDGPFSRFEGVDRTLVILDGAGFELAVEGAAPVRLTPASAPLFFPADAPASARLLAGPVNDLNVMVRRGAWASRVERRKVAGEVRCTAEVCLVLALGRCAADGASLEPGDAVRLEAGEAAVLDGPGEVIVVALSRL
ncbi:MAG TPA: HutD family protein [Caulobacteraceae bacterium]|jgi:environmental stress-induced protein Ves|nr:HutD family protein [Caulobacteraceae bacterium]